MTDDWDIESALRRRAVTQTATGISELSEQIEWMAADTIEALRAENARLYEWKDKAGDMDRVKTVELVALRAENARLNSERLLEHPGNIAGNPAKWRFTVFDMQKKDAEIARLREELEKAKEIIAWHQ